MEKSIVWRATLPGGGGKTQNWYWTVGILTVGVAASSLIFGNLLLSILVLFGGFAVMLAGSRPQIERQYALSEKGVHIDAQIVSWSKITAFAIEDNEGSLFFTIQTETLLGTTSLPLGSTDYREIQMECRNRDIEEVESLDTLTEAITRALGL